jgi:hypothetical protein
MRDWYNLIINVMLWGFFTVPWLWSVSGTLGNVFFDLGLKLKPGHTKTFFQDTMHGVFFLLLQYFVSLALNKPWEIF